MNTMNPEGAYNASSDNTKPDEKRLGGEGPAREDYYYLHMCLYIYVSELFRDFRPQAREKELCSFFRPT